MHLSPTHHHKILLSNKNVQTGSRIGGTPPEAIAENTVCPECKRKIQYVLTLGNDILGEHIGNNELSFFVCKDFDCRWDGQAVIHPSPLIFIVHPVSPRKKDPTDMDSPCDALGFYRGELEPDFVDEESGYCDDSKLGGKPTYIQSRGEEEVEEIQKEGYEFFFQYSQPVFPDEFSGGTDPFGFGVVYVFAKKDAATGLMDCNNIRAFWLK